MSATPRVKGAWMLAAASLALAILVISQRTSAAMAADYNIRLHTNQPALTSSYHYVFGKRFSDLASKYSNGRIAVTIFPSSQLGRDPEVFQQIQIGAVQMGIFAFPNVVEFYAPLNIFNMPYLFDDFDGAARALMGPTAQSIYRSFEEKAGVRALGVFNGGYRGVTNRVREIKDIEDMKGLKIRVPGSPILIDTMKAMGANPVSISAGDLFTALQLGTVDGQESGVSWSFGQGYAEVQKHLTLTEHAVSGTGLFVNAAFFDKLPSEVRDALSRATQESLKVVNDYCRELDEATAGKYRAAGLTVTKLPASEVRPLMKPVWDKYAPQVGGLDTINALVADGQMKPAK